MSKQSSYSRKLTLDSPERKPSVFERLGTKPASSSKSLCESWAQNGTCPNNKACKYGNSHVLISPSKRTKTEMKKQSVVVPKKASKDDHKKHAKGRQSAEVDWDCWELENLEGADEKALERRRQELQRELQLQLKKEKELVKKKDKKGDKKRTRSTSSSSTTTTESSSSTSSSSSSSSAPRKRLSRKRKQDATSSESDGSPHRQKKSPKLAKAKTAVAGKSKSEKKDPKTSSKAIVKKTTAQKKSASPSWDRSRARSPAKPSSKKSSPHHSCERKEGSASPRYYSKERHSSNTKTVSPKAKTKALSPKRTVRKAKDGGRHSKERSAKPGGPSKARSPPLRPHKGSPPRPRRHEDQDKRRPHHDDRKHSPRRERSREKDRKRDTRRRSTEEETRGLKKGGKILPLRRASYTRETAAKPKEAGNKPTEKPENKNKEEDSERDRGRYDREKDKEKSRSDREKEKDRKEDEHDRKAARDRDVRSRDGDRTKEREAERARLAKEREAERQRERDEALERCRERQREREKIQKEKDEKKHHRDHPDSKKDHDRELPSLMDLKTEHPARSHDSKPGDKHGLRDCRRGEKPSDKGDSRELPKSATPEKDHGDRRDGRRSDDERRALEARRARDGREVRDPHPSDHVVRRTLTEGRRPWDRIMDERRRALDDRRPLPMLPRPGEEYDYRRVRDEAEELRLDERRRKLAHGFLHDGPPSWDGKDPDLDYRDAERREEWAHSERHRDWARYERKWLEHEDDPNWNHYRRPGGASQAGPGGEEWTSEWPPEETPEEARHGEHAKRHAEPEAASSPAGPEPEGGRGEWEASKANPSAGAEAEVKDAAATAATDGLGEALSDISDDADDILNQDDDGDDANPTNVTGSGGGTGTAQPAQPGAAPQPASDFFFEQRRPLLDCFGERALDFEEISDEELEEEARISRGIMDVLGADWAGLVQQTRPRPKRPELPGSAHRRWRIDQVVARLGISYKFAGSAFASELLEKCKQAAKTDEPGAVKDEGQQEPMEVDGKEVAAAEEPVTLLAAVPAIHVAMVEAKAARASLFLSHSRFKRALSARTDLAVRRELCNLAAREPLLVTQPMDSSLYQASVALFQRPVTGQV